VPDVLTLQATNGLGDGGRSDAPIAGATAVISAPPRVRLSDRVEVEPFTRRQRSVVIHHASDDRIIALIEVLSAGNKSSNREFDAFTTKAVDALDRSYHLLLIDFHPCTGRDPMGIHPIIWAEVGGKPTPVPADKPLTLVAYDAGPPKIAYLEPVAVGDSLIDMPLFLAPGWYVSVPLEATYQAAWGGVPRRYRAVLEPGG
jgi:hypothetical protein